MSTANGSLLPADTRYAAAEDHYLAAQARRERERAAAARRQAEEERRREDLAHRRERLERLQAAEAIRLEVAAQRLAEGNSATELQIIANMRSKKFYRPGDPRYARALSQVNVIVFADESQAEAAGYRPA